MVAPPRVRGMNEFLVIEIKSTDIISAFGEQLFVPILRFRRVDRNVLGIGDLQTFAEINVMFHFNSVQPGHSRWPTCSPISSRYILNVVFVVTSR